MICCQRRLAALIWIKRNLVPHLYGTRFRLSIGGVVSDKAQDPNDGIEPRGRTVRHVRADAQRNIDTLLKTAMAVFATSGVDAPVREIAEKAGVGVGTIYRHFPQRSGLIAAVFRREIDACANTASVLAGEHEPGEALARWMQRYVEFIAAKRGLAKALHSGDPAFDTLPAYFKQRLEPALRALLKSAASSDQVRTDIDAEELLGAVASLCMHAYEKGPKQARRMVSLLVDGLRYGARSAPKPKKAAHRKS
jgi:AcrR family transcriptional regulator